MQTSLPYSVGERKRKIPHLVGAARYAPLMPCIEPKRILWANVLALMQHHWGEENLTRLSREARIGPGTCTRIKAQETSVGIDVLQKIAAAFDLQAWHLLTPGLDPANPPVIYLSEREKLLYDNLRAAAKALNGPQSH